MNIALIRVLFALLVPIGIFLLVKGIKLLLKFTGAKTLLKIPIYQGLASFTVNKDGKYAIWQSGRKLQRVPITMKSPVITNQQTGNRIGIYNTLSRVYVNDGSNGRIQVFTFTANAGTYNLELPEATSNIELLYAGKALQTTSRTEAYFLEIKEHKPAYLLVFSILIILLAAACTITGFILAINTPQVFK
jgi:hypothetical protein